MKKLYIIFFVAIAMQINGFAQTTFPLDIGNKWYYQAGSNRNEVYGIVKEVTDTLSNGFREITSKYFSRTGVSTQNEYWWDIGGKLYINGSSPQIENALKIYDHSLTHDSCETIFSTWSDNCWELIEFKVFNIWDSAQKYIERWGGHAYTAKRTIIVLPQLGIVNTWLSVDFPEPQYHDIQDSTYLIGMYRNGEVFGDTLTINQYRIPSLSSPLNGALSMPLALTLQWNKAIEVNSYRLQVATDYDFSNTVADYSGLTDTLKVIGPIRDITKFYWRVFAQSNNGHEYVSTTFNFSTIVDTDNIPKLLTPSNETSGVAQPLTFKWSKVPDTETYEFQIATDSLCHQTVLDRIVRDDTVIVIDSLVMNKKYYWRVKKISSDLYWSKSFSFTTEGAPIEFNLEQNYPNPFNGTTKFRYALSNKSKITIRLFNVLGESVATLLDSEVVPGAYSLSVDAASLPSGIYFYQMRAGDFVQTKKMILLR